MEAVVRGMNGNGFAAGGMVRTTGMAKNPGALHFIVRIFIRFDSDIDPPVGECTSGAALFRPAPSQAGPGFIRRPREKV